MDLSTPQPLPTDLTAYNALANALRDRVTDPSITSASEAVWNLIAEVERLRQVIADRDEKAMERWERAE